MSSYPTGSLEPPSPGRPLIQTITPLSVKCRCGTHVSPGGQIISLASVPGSLRSIFRGGVFCSSKCVRAFCLESLEIVDALDSPAASEMVTDLHDLYRAIALMLASTLES